MFEMNDIVYLTTKIDAFEHPPVGTRGIIKHVTYHQTYDILWDGETGVRHNYRASDFESRVPLCMEDTRAYLEGISHARF